MADEVQPSPRTNKLNRWVGWCVVLAVLGMVALWGGFVLAHIPREAALPPWLAPTLISLGLALCMVSVGGLFIAYRYLRRLIRLQRRPREQ